MLSAIHGLHVGLATFALVLFVWRGMRMWRRHAVKSLLWRRIVPDSIDTMLLLSGVAMLLMLGWNPLHQPWLLAKLTAVLAYIGLGFVALHPGLVHVPRRAAFVAALLAFAYIVAVAHSKTVWF